MEVSGGGDGKYGRTGKDFFVLIRHNSDSCMDSESRARVEQYCARFGESTEHGMDEMKMRMTGTKALCMC